MYIRYSFLRIALFFSISSVASAQWIREQSPYPGGQDDAVVSFTIGDSLYVGGGSNGSTNFYRFDPSTSTWAKRASLPHAMAFGVNFTIGSKGYTALGQSNPTAGDFPTEQGSVTNELWCYDPSTDAWTPKSKFPFLRFDGAFAFSLSGLGYVGGGVDSIGEGWNEFFSYDPSTDQWSQLNPLPFGASVFPAYFSLQNFGYIVTGNDSNLVWQYDPTQDSWNQLSDFPGGNRESAVSFILNGVPYLGLGEYQFATVYKNFYSYNVSNDTWAPVPLLAFKNGRGWSMAGVVGDTAYVGLGFDFTSFYSDLQKFSPSTAAVTEQPANSSVAIYPNPTKRDLYLSIPQHGAHVRVCNAIGCEVLSKDVSTGSELNVSSLPSGIYEIEISSGDYHSTQRFVKE